MSAARKRAYDSTTHCAPETVACSACWILGKATFTTVPSMKAMLEPRIAAARTQPLRAPAPPRTMASDCSTESQGYFNLSPPSHWRDLRGAAPRPLTSVCRPFRGLSLVVVYPALPRWATIVLRFGAGDSKLHRLNLPADFFR